jgi:rare lipoprotein A
VIVCASTVLAATLTVACPPTTAVHPAAHVAPTSAGPTPGEEVDVPPSSTSSPAPSLTGPCVASWYGEPHRGLTQANREPFDPDALTVAAWDYPFGTVLEVHHQGVTVEVEVTDRGPARRLGRCLDLSLAAFEVLAPAGAGLIDVEYRQVDR